MGKCYTCGCQIGPILTEEQQIENAKMWQEIDASCHKLIMNSQVRHEVQGHERFWMKVISEYGPVHVSVSKCTHTPRCPECSQNMLKIDQGWFCYQCKSTWVKS